MSETALLAKLREVAEAIPFVEKRGENTHHKYNFVQAVDVARTVREELLKRGVVCIPGAGNARHEIYQAARGGTAFLTTVDLRYTFQDVETGAKIEVPWVGVGADTGGDKGIYKAYTGGFKYALLGLFMIPTSDDPERDQLSEQAPPEQSPEPHKDDARPPAPQIPVDRARLILDAAVAVKLATANPVTLEPVFKAVLAQHGVEKIGQLNVDQAEAVEGFLKEEAARG